MKNNIDVILTDIGGVIYKSTGIGIAVSNFLNLNRKDKIVQKTIDMFMDSFVESVSEEELWNRIAVITNKDMEDVHKLIDYFDYTINYEFLHYLKELSKEYKIGIVSDNNSIIYEMVKKNIPDFDNIFDKNYIFLSFIENDSKYLTGKHFFDNIINKINIEGNRILFIDDKIDNVKNAKKSKMMALQYIKTENEEKDNQKIFDEINEILNRSKDE